MSDIRFEIPKGTPAAKCKGCQEYIYWIKTRNDKNMPVNADGVSHFSTCAKASDFRKNRKPVVVIAPAKFLPLLNDLKDYMDDIEAAGDADGHGFIERLLLLKEDNQLHQITDEQFTFLESLYEKYCA